MLDLNIDAVSVDSFSDENKFLTPVEKKLLEYATGADSGTSMSSVVNADEADSSSTFNFDIMFNGPKCDRSSTRSTHELITRQLFPVISGDKDDLELFRSKSSSPTSLLRPQWLNLSFPESVVEHQLSVFEDQKPPPPPPPTQPAVRKSRRGPRSRSSQYRGVTFYRRTGRWESHIWDCGKQLYLGGFDTAHAAARAYDRAAVKFRGVDADINFTITDYEDLKQMKDLTKEEFVHVLRRQSSGFSRGSSKYRGVNLHKCGRWEARNGLFLGKKYMYLGLFNSEIEAARAYDEAVIESNRRELLTNFETTTYEGQLSLVNKNQDIHHNLNLSLWISPPSGVKKGNDNVRGSHLHDSAYHLLDVKRTKAESFASAPMGGETPHSLSMEMNYLSTWPCIYSGLPNYEERAIGKNEAEAVPLPEFSNWAWQMKGEGVVNHVPLLSTAAAASSGFSSTTTTTPPVFSGFSHLLPLNTQNKKLCPPTPANASSFYYSHKN